MPGLTRRFGRKPILIICQFTTIITWLLFAFGTSFYVFLTAGIFTGIATGSAIVVGQLYLLEIAATKTRGFITGTTAIWIVVYNLVDYVLGAFLLWKWIALVNCSILIIHLALTWAVAPESPLWLLSQGRLEEAERVLASLGRTPERRVNNGSKLKIMYHYC